MTDTSSRSPALSLDRIVDEAIALLDEEGPTALSMRKLAARLGVSTMSTYHHVADKEALVERIAERTMSALTLPAPDASWQDAVRTLSWSFRAVTLEHPSVFRVMLGGPRPTAMLRTGVAARSLLTDRGFDEHEAVLVFRTVLRYLVGSTLGELVGFGGPAMTYGETGAEEQFEYGLEAVIAGVEARRTS